MGTIATLPSNMQINYIYIFVFSDSRSTPTKTDKSSSDSGVCINMEEQSTINNTYVNPDIDDMNSSDVNSADKLNMSPNYSGNNLVRNSTFNEDDQKLETSLQRDNEKRTEKQTFSNIDVEHLWGRGNTNELPTWPIHTRRSARNYRHSTQDDGQDEEEEAEMEGGPVNATEEEQMVGFY